MSKTLVVKCPICKVLVERKADTFPFCSERCQTVDLGNWASDAYAIPDNNSVVEPSLISLDDDDRVIH